MSGNEEIALSVNKLLEEIDNLKVSRDESEGDPAKVTYFQCVIFQKLATIDSLMGYCSETEEVVKFKDQVSLKKRELGAEVEDLNRMLIPRSLEAKTVEKWKSGKENESFPFYLSLPPEVRRMILEFLTSPSDKLSLAKAIPSDGVMMDWHVNSLGLELVLPIVFAGDRKIPLLRYKETLNLCRASAELHSVVQNCYERTVADPIAASSGRNYVGWDSLYPQGLSPENVISPIPATISFEYDYADEEPGEDEEREWIMLNKESLRNFGENVWSFSLEIKTAPSSREMLLLLRDCLELMPNLRYLAVDIDLKKERRSPDVRELEDIQLPELGHLQGLVLWGYQREAVYAKLLEKYRSRITSLLTRNPSSLPAFAVREAAYPRLTYLDANIDDEENDDFDWEPVNIVRKLNTFAGSPLKVLKVHGGYDRHNAQDFIRVMTAINQFGKTLEYLSVEFAFEKLPGDDDEEIELAKLVDLNFPKVKTLEVKLYPRTWTFLLQFPALEHLTVTLFGTSDFPRGSVSTVVGWSELDLSLVQVELFTSNVWKLLPFLKTISLNGGTRSTSQVVTRSQCRAYQRKLVEIKGQLGEADITMKGSVNSIVQPSGTSLVVEGDVNGDMVQDGNGCILVYGKVDGKIEQKGDGKIFVRGKHHGALVKTGNGVVKVDWGNINN